MIKNQVLTAIIGEKGLAALDPLLKEESLASFILPKAIIAYLRGSAEGDLKIPGIEGLRKTESLYFGSVVLDGVDHYFSKATEVDVAAIVSILADNPIESDLKNLDLARLSKTIEMLVKTQQKVVSKEPEADVAKQIEPIKAIPKAGPVNSRVRREVIKSALIPNKDISKVCKMCKKEMFTNKQFTGCTCLKSLAKSVTSEVNSLGVTLIFNKNLDEDAVYTILEACRD